MKLAIISDIHGNLQALQAARNEIARAHVDYVLALGDYFDPSSAPQEILQILRELGAVCIRGNGEGYQVQNHSGKNGNLWEQYDQFAALRVIAEQLTEDDFAWTEALPAQIALQFDDFSLRMVHGSPKSDRENLLIDQPKQLKSALQAMPEQVLLCGHSHRRFLWGHKSRYICNVGSVGLNFDPAFTADITFMTYHNGKLSFDQRRVPYDFEARKRAALDHSMPYTRLCIRGTEQGRINGQDLWVDFLDEAGKRADGFPISNEIWRGLFAEWEAQGRV